jgi:hypothetical protein
LALIANASRERRDALAKAARDLGYVVVSESSDGE